MLLHNSGLIRQTKWIWTDDKTRAPFHVSYFRRCFELNGPLPSSCKLRCCADSKYRLWVNGIYIGFGPARGTKNRPYYDTHDITTHLRKGTNVIAFLVQYYTAGTNIFAAVHGGLICQLDIGEKQGVVVSNSNWHAMTSKAYGSLEGLHFPEKFDSRNEPKEWQSLTFDDSDWVFAMELNLPLLASPENLRPRPIPLIPEICCRPDIILDIGRCRDRECENIANENRVALSLFRSVLEPPQEGDFDHDIFSHSVWTGKPLNIRLPEKGTAIYLCLDFGRNILAAPEIVLQGPPGTVVDLGYSELLENNRVNPLREGLAHNDRIILGEDRTVHRFLQPRGFRFLMLRIAGFNGTVILYNLCAYESTYPAKKIGIFRASDPLLERIYQLCARTVNLCMEDGYTDCPWRERSQWLGDIQPEALFSYYCFGSYDMARKAVLEFAESNTPEGWIPGVFPVTQPFNLPTWGMRFPIIVWEYYLYTGDRETLFLAYSAITQQMTWLAKYENTYGLLENMPGWSFVDWTPTDRKEGDGAIQGWYLDALKHAALIADAVQDKTAATAYKHKAKKLRSTLVDFYWSEHRSAFLKYRLSCSKRPFNASDDLIGQHENFLFSILNVGTPHMRRQALDAIKGATGRYLPNLGNYQSFYSTPDGQKGNVSTERTILLGSPFWSFYALLALMEADEDLAAVDYIRLCWGLMLEHGATSCWEMWDRNTSLCHGWSAAPAMILPAYILGVSPITPGFCEFLVKPKVVNLNWAKGKIPTPKGVIRVSWKIITGKKRLFLLTISVPNGTSARFVRPREFAQAHTCLDGKNAPKNRKEIQLCPGKHEIELSMRSIR